MYILPPDGEGALHALHRWRLTTPDVKLQDPNARYGERVTVFAGTRRLT